MTIKNDGSNNNYNIILSIDFGTTYSGCCYHQLLSPTSENVKCKTEMITIWPKMGNTSSAKVPTELLYIENKGALWGYRARHYKQQHQNDSPKLITNFKKQYKEPETFKLVSDYLKGLTEHAFSTISKTTKQQVNNLEPSYCVLVPAVADDEARSRMRRAMLNADLITQQDDPKRLFLAPEPEAVAIFCLDNRKEMNLKTKETMLICNAGGGITDLCLYKLVPAQAPIENDTSNSKSTSIQDKNDSMDAKGKISGENSSVDEAVLEEVALGVGELHGATVIDEKMRKYIQSIFESQKKKISEEALDFMMLDFISRVKPLVELIDETGEADIVKDSEQSNSDKSIIALHPSLYECDFKLSDVQVQNGVMEIDMKVIANEIFKPVVAEIIGLINKQINLYRPNTIDHMILTGGFSQSGYFYKSIKKAFSDKVKSIRSFQDSEDIAMKGAVTLGLYPNKISKRILRRTYGIRSLMRFDNSFFKNDIDNKNQYVSWLLRKNTSQSVFRPITGKYDAPFPPPNFKAEIFAFDEEVGEDEIDGKQKKDVTSFQLNDPKCSAVATFDIPFPTDLKAPSKEEKVTYCVQLFLVQTEIKIIILIDDYIGEFVSIFSDDKVGPPFDYRSGWKKKGGAHNKS